ncbi:histidine phosphatase family protein [Amycolatopsis sp. NPDC049868]|uniref:histidine phosphatase family protein n=1 Tax=Amycolatopsis sp. NPDC049868 TaxID=3363934 RepID=UPI0037A3251E
MKLLLVRHAQTEGNLRGALETTVPGPLLTEAGEQQARSLVTRLDGKPIVAVYASQAIRAQQTAAPLAATLDLPVEVITGVKEVDAGDLENRNDQEARSIYLNTVGRWTRGDLAIAIPGGETGEQVRARMLAAVAALRSAHERIHPDGTIVLVSHGGVIRLGAQWLVPTIRSDIADSALIPNAGTIELEAVPAGWHCLAWGDRVIEFR